MYTQGHIHFVGIGGIGMSGIAKILRLQGYTISGCDSDLTQKSVIDLQNLGCTIYKGNNTPECRDHTIDVLVYSSAIRESNEEITYAQSRGIPTIPRALMLSEIMRTKFSIAVSGSHGKTTVTSLISHILIEAQQDPTVIIGGHLKAISSNAQHGSGKFLVAEADESDRSFLKLFPTIAVITNINLEHLDVYKDLDDIKKTFQEFITHVPFYGKAVVCNDDPNIRSILPLNQIKTIKYGLDQEGSDIYGTNSILETYQSSCTVYKHGELLGDLTIAMAGKHNLLNALAALSAALEVGVSFEIAAQALKSFKGVDRRFTYKGIFQGAEVIDDYGHHPTEIHNTLLVARKRAKGKLIVVFQPQRFSRTQLLWDDFVNLFAHSAIDELVITDIFPGPGEIPRPEVSTQELVKAIRAKRPGCPVTYVPQSEYFTEIHEFLTAKATTDDLILLQGAGKVTKLGPLLTQSE